MRLWQAIGYLIREALVSLRRGWRVGVLAAFTIAMSLFVSGLFLLLGTNLDAAVAAWRSSARVVVYLDPEAAEEVRDGVIAALDASWIKGFEEVTAEEAHERFIAAFPSMADVVDDDGGALPPSFEIEALATANQNEMVAGMAALRDLPGVALVDDDRDWLDELNSLVSVLRAASLALGALLVVAAVFTTASVIRLTAYLYREEIDVMRLVGATELLIRGPFYCEGLLQGIAGGLGALGALWGVQTWLASQGAMLGDLIAGRFLPWPHALALVALGGMAGLIGAVVSLRREIESGTAAT